MRTRNRLAALFLWFSVFCLFSCSRPVVHVHDRHVHSHAPVKSWARRHPRASLLLLDYHHDVGPRMPSLSSVDWIGDLLSSGSLDRLIWVSGRDLELPNRASRMDWLKRSVADLPPAEASRLLDRISLMDWEELRIAELRGPLALSLDLDILTKDPGDPPERFLDELASWIRERRPELLTIALSSAYQPDSQRAWAWLARAAEALDLPGASWRLEAGTYAPGPESREEAASWEGWSRSGSSFRPGAALWLDCPPQAAQALLARGIRPGDGPAADILSSWADAELCALKAEFPEDRIRELAAIAAGAMATAWEEDPADREWGECVAAAPPATGRGRGVAVRIRNRGLDRGCLALWTGVEDVEGAVSACARAALSDPRYPPVAASEAPDLSVEISLFGPWEVRKDPLSFRAGVDSLIVEEAGEKTLLQASLAVQRGLDREGFLSILSRKAGLGEGGWKKKGLEFFASATLAREYQFSQIMVKK